VNPKQWTGSCGASKDALENLSGVARRLSDMSTLNDTFDPTQVFADPVTFLAQFGIEAELLTEDDEGLALAA